MSRLWKPKAPLGPGKTKAYTCLILFGVVKLYCTLIVTVMPQITGDTSQGYRSGSDLFRSIDYSKEKIRLV